ncbi:MAG: sigma-54-dependent Fis family transcriptional regulator, partial [Planctomycetes bacterium]|nr:sigma-54-dependent Fis family transcriptional regulator [Planctomycetota bacterium]
EALQLLQRESYDVIITDLKMPGMTGLEFMAQLQTRGHDAGVVMVTAYASVQTAVEAMRLGAFDYIEKPFGADQIERPVARALEHRWLVDPRGALSAGPTDSTGVPNMIGSSRAMCELKSRIAQVAPTPETVLILGETGTGKELVARSLHAQSDRAAGPLVSVNCPVLAAQLTESELFGHERGAFTGADTARTGRFELAHGGSIHLDEVTEIDLVLQAKLLRVLQEKAFERVGGSETIAADVRVLASTNRDLQTEVSSGRFREDLYYRLAVVPLHVPPLRQRREDIPELVEHFNREAARRLGREPISLDAGAVELLVQYHWPGNVRELENVVARAVVLCKGTRLSESDLPPKLLEAAANFVPVETYTPMPLKQALERPEKRILEAALLANGWNRQATAEQLDINRTTLYKKMKRYGLDREPLRMGF